MDSAEVKPNLKQASLQANKDICAYCFQVIIKHLLPNCNEPDVNLLASIPSQAQCPVFITWDILHQSEYRLRGCIGNLSPLPLRTAIGDYAATSAFRDSRFDPINISEVSSLRVGVSLLVQYEECQNCYDWIVGTHGIIIRFNYMGVDYHATFLPEVAPQQGWNQQETISHLTYKAGFRGVLNNEILSSIHCTRYQSSKERLTYKEFVALQNFDPLGNLNSMRNENSSNKSWKNFFLQR